MKIIKFRLIKNNKIVGYEIHKDGKIYHDNDCNDIKYNILKVKCKCTGYATNDPEHEYYIEHDNKEQFINKLDKNNKEIYENDILQGITYKEPWAMKTSAICTGIVKWSDMHCCYIFHVNLPKSFRTYPNFNECNIIGNIHNNNELLTIIEKDNYKISIFFV